MCQTREKQSVNDFTFNTLTMKTLLRYCVGIDVSKDTLQVCFSAIDAEQSVTVKATTSFANQPTGFQALLKWVAKHRKQALPLRYVMESTGVYHEQLAWYPLPAGPSGKHPIAQQG